MVADMLTRRAPAWQLSNTGGMSHATIYKKLMLGALAYGFGRKVCMTQGATLDKETHNRYSSNSSDESDRIRPMLLSERMMAVAVGGMYSTACAPFYMLSDAGRLEVWARGGDPKEYGYNSDRFRTIGDYIFY